MPSSRTKIIKLFTKKKSIDERVDDAVEELRRAGVYPCDAEAYQKCRDIVKKLIES